MVTVAMLVQTESQYDIRRIVGRFMSVQDNGELHNISWYRFDDARVRGLADLAVTGYVGERDSSFVGPYKNGKIWGLGHEYDPHRITDVQHARDIANTLGRIERGLTAANASAGYVADGDFHAYALRIAGALKVSTFYVRSFASGQERSGERYQKVNGSGLQFYVGTVEQLAGERKFAELNER